MAGPQSSDPQIGSGGRIARWLAVAAPPLAWLVGTLNVLVLSRSEIGLNPAPSWALIGVAGVVTGLMAYRVHRMLVATPRPRDLFALLALPALPWVFGSLSALLRSEAVLRDPSIAGLAGYALSFVPGMQGANLAWGLFGSAAFGLTVATFIRRNKPVQGADGALVALSVLPVVILAVGVFSGSGRFTGSVIANPVSALFVLPFVGAATRRNPSSTATVPAIGAGWAFALSFAAAMSFAYGIGVAQMLFAITSTAGAGTELWQAALAELGRQRLWALVGILLALLPAGAIAWQLRRQGRAIEPSLFSAAAVLVLGVGIQFVFTARAQEMLAAFTTSGPSRPAPLADSTALGSDSVSRPPELTVPVSPVVGGVEGGVAGGVIGGVLAEPPARVSPPAPVSPPLLLSSVPPEYPAIAKQAGSQGIVVVQVEIDTSGRVVRASALTGPQLLREAAVAAVLRWRYRPAMQGGHPIGAKKAEPVNFALPP